MFQRYLFIIVFAVSFCFQGCVQPEGDDIPETIVVVNKLPRMMADSLANPALQDLFKSGYDFLGTGNEPFWSIKIDSTQRLHFQLLGADSLVTAPSKELSGKGMLSYEAATDSGLLRLTIIDSSCINDMSGDTISKTVRVMVGEKVFSGCGQWLKRK